MGKSRQKSLKKEEQGGTAGGEVPMALCFELDTLAVKGRLAAYDLLQDLLKDRKLELTRMGFCQHALRGTVAQGVTSLLKDLGGGRLSPEKLADDLRRALEMFYASDEAQLDPGLEALLAACPAATPIGACSGLPEKQAAALMERLGLSARGVRLFCFEEAEEFPGVDVWMQVVKEMGRPSGSVLALVSSETSTHGALAAGMACAVLPDAFTSFQDFGGADLVLDALAEEQLTELKACLKWAPSR